MNQSMSPWMTIGETAKHIRMSVGFLRKCVRRRTVPFARIDTKALRFRREDIDRWLEATGCGPLAGAAGDHGREIAQNDTQIANVGSRDDVVPNDAARVAAGPTMNRKWPENDRERDGAQ